MPNLKLITYEHDKDGTWSVYYVNGHKLVTILEPSIKPDMVMRIIGICEKVAEMVYMDG